MWAWRWCGCWSDLPVHLRWIDSRDEVFPPGVPAPACSCRALRDLVHAAGGSTCQCVQRCAVIMSFSHAEDLDVVSACLQRQRAQGDLPYIGLIGSQTKWA